MKIKFCEETREKLLELKKSKGIHIEGNILKIIDSDGDSDMAEYTENAIASQKDIQRKRLLINKKVQAQNRELLDKSKELNKALKDAENSKENALKDLDVLQKKTQFELVSVIVKISLAIIIGVGLCTTILYMFSLYYGKETQLIGNTWSNMFGILLTNAFSIIGTIMGVKYASKGDGSKG